MCSTNIEFKKLTLRVFLIRSLSIPMTGLRMTLSFSITEVYCTLLLARLRRIKFVLSTNAISRHRTIPLVPTRRMSRSGHRHMTPTRKRRPRRSHSQGSLSIVSSLYTTLPATLPCFRSGFLSLSHTPLIVASCIFYCHFGSCVNNMDLHFRS